LNLRERLPFIALIILSIAVVLGLVELIPHLRVDEPLLSFHPVDGQMAEKVSVVVDGDVLYPGLYDFDAGTPIGELLERAGCSEYPQTVQLIIGTDEALASPQRVDLNRAEQWLLEALPGIGPTKAAAIVQYRACHGPFTYIEQVQRVEGIGESTFQEIAPFLTVTGS